MIELFYRRLSALSASVSPIAWKTVIAASFAVRLALWLASEGSGDARTWRLFALAIERDGVLALYAHEQSFNHPPLMGLYALMALKASLAVGAPFATIFKLLPMGADAAAAFVLSRRSWPMAAVLASAPVSLWITCHHGNSDSACAALACAAAVLVDRATAVRGPAAADANRDAWLAGLVFAAALNVKLLPLVLGPALFTMQARSWRSGAAFAIGVAMGCAPFVAPLVVTPEAFYRNAIAYNSHPNTWGLHELFSLGFGVEHLNMPLRLVDAQWARCARYVIMTASLGAGVWGRRRGRRAIEVIALVYAIFLVLTPGIGIQYLIYPLLPILLVDKRLGAVYGVVAGAFCTVVYVSFMKHWWPMASVHAHAFPLPAVVIGLALWAGLAWFVIVRLGVPRAVARVGRRGLARGGARSAMRARGRRALAHPRVVVGVIVALGALRVTVFAAAFPLFANVDEKQHADAVIAAHWCRLTRALPHYHPTAAPLQVRDASPEYGQSAAKVRALRRARPLPFERASDDEALAEPLREARIRFAKAHSYEAQQPPLYYIFGHAVYRATRFAGAGPAHALYAVRLANAPLYAFFLVVAFLAARRALARTVPALATVALLAFIPQDAMYLITNDALLPFTGALVVWAWLAFAEALGATVPPARALGQGALLGLACAAAFLTKLSPLPLVGAVCVAAVALLLRAPAGRTARATVAGFAGFVAAAVPGPLWWCLRNHAAGVGVFANEPKVRLLGWTAKPLSQWLDHPLFSFAGAREMLSELFASLWRGEIVWSGRERLHAAIADGLYLAVSLGAVVVVALALAVTYQWCRRAQRTGETPSLLRRRRAGALAFSLVALLGFVAFLAGLSLAFDFGSCPYPSRAHPFFVSGRLLLAGLLPFALVVVGAIAHGVSARRARVWLAVFLCLTAITTAGSELAVSQDVFRSPWNLLHLPWRE